MRVPGERRIAFADELERINPRKNCDLLVSLERIWRCDFFRAGDGVHRAWLERKTQFESKLTKITRRFNSKHAAILRLELKRRVIFVSFDSNCVLRSSRSEEHTSELQSLRNL